MNPLFRLVSNSPKRLAMPIAVYPGARLTGAKIKALVTDAQAQFDASRALHERFQASIVLSAMDLSAEAEAFGCELQMADNEVPTVTGRLVSSMAEAQTLAVPSPGTARTGVYLETVRYLKHLPNRPLVLGGCIGPFSLTGRLAGLSEICELSLTEPELVHLLLEKSTAFLTGYVQAFKTAGADGVIMAEPAAGLLSPRALAAFSSAYIRRIVEAIEDGSFGLVVHNCAARLPHLPAVLESGASVFHFGAPMDIASALNKVPADVVVCGNLDPISLFVQASTVDLTCSVVSLLEATATRRNFIISSGCDVPYAAPLANLDAFFDAVRRTAAHPA